MSEIIESVKNLSIGFNSQKGKQISILRNVSTNIKKGETVGIVGESGSGKSTLALAMMGYIKQGLFPLKGECLFKSEDLLKMSSRQLEKIRGRKIAMIPQNAGQALTPNLKIGYQIDEALRLHTDLNKSERDKKISELLNKVRLPSPETMAFRYPHELSGGQQQRVAVARSLVFDPQLVLMDEPLGALDKNLRESMQYEIKHIHESIGVTVVYVTHDQSEALTMSNRIAVFNDGKVQQLSSPAELYEKPVNSFVAEFIGENNTFNGEVSDISGDECKVKLSNAEILSNAISVKSKGEKTTVSLRPERALIEPTEKMDNMFSGKIEEVIYHGDHTRVRVNLLGNPEFILKVPNSTSNLELKVSQEIKIGWNSYDARALDPK